MKSIFRQLLVSFLALGLAVLFIPGVEIAGSGGSKVKTFIISVLILALAAHFLKPLLRIIGSPLKIFTFGFFGLIINILIVWFTDIVLPDLVVLGFWPLVWTGLAVSVANFVAARIDKKE